MSQYADDDNEVTPEPPIEPQDKTITGGQFMIRLIAVLIIGAIAFAAYEFTRPEPEAPKPSRKGQPPTGNDYFSTAFRARHRAQEKLGKADEERKEQVAEEESFDDKGNAGSADKAEPASSDPTP